MNNNHYNSVDPNNGNVTWEGPLYVQPGNHFGMPPRTESYLPGENETGTYDRGHINASSLGGPNSTDNIVPQHSNLNRAGGGYYAMEQGERSALKNGAVIDSTKTAVVNAHPGDKPEAFMVSDNVTYSDGHSEYIHHSFTNASYAEQQAWNDLSVTLPDTFDAPNPEDGLRSSMSSAEYSELMENTDAELPGISEDYAAADFSSVPGADSVASDSDADTFAAGEAVEIAADDDSSVDCNSVDCNTDN